MKRFVSALLVWSLLALPAAAQGPKDKATPVLVLDPGGHTQDIKRLLFSADNKQLISVGEDKTIRIWDVDSGEQLRVLRPPMGPGMAGSLTAAALSPDGKTLAVAAYAHPEGKERHVPIYLINLDKGTLNQVLRGHTNTVTSLTFSPDGERLASGGLDDNPRVWNLDKDQSRLTLRWAPQANYQKHVAFSPDGMSLAVVTETGKGAIFALARAKVSTVFETKGKVQDMAWSPDGKTIATAGASLQLWNPDGTLRSTKEFKEFQLFKERKILYANSLAFSADSRKLLFTYATNVSTRGMLFDLGSDQELVDFKMSGLSKAVLSPDGNLVAVGGSGYGQTHFIYLYKASDGSIVHKLGMKNWHTQGNADVSWTADGKSVAWPKGGSFHLGELQFGPGVRPENLRGAVKEEGGRSLKIGSYQVNVVKEGSPDVGLKLDVAGYGPQSSTFLGKDRAVVGNNSGDLYLFDAGSGERLRLWHGHNGRAYAGAPSPDGRYCLSYSAGDALIHIWSPERDRPLLTLFVMGPAISGNKSVGDWVAWTPEGFYAASPGGEKLISWHLDQGPNNMAKIVPASQYRKLLYRPDVISRVLEFGSVEKALEAADKAAGRKTQVRDVTQVVPAKVILTAPTGTKLTQPKVTVEAKSEAAKDQPVVALQLLLDGRPYQGDNGIRKPEPGKPTTWEVELPPGNHELAVLAQTAVSTSRSAELKVIYAPSSPPSAKSQQPALYVLAVGINAYPGDWKLACATNDAAKLQQTFLNKSKRVFGDVQALVLTDKEASKSGILKGLDWLKQCMRPQDVAVIFYAGHGAKDDKGQFFLLPADADFQALARTAITGDQLKKRLAELPGRILLLLDACHSGAIGARPKGATSLTDELTRELTDDDCGVVVMCAAMGREEAGEQRDLGHGYFALALIEGLSGKADSRRRDGMVYLHHLEHYVIDRVQELSNDEQHPVTGKPTTVRSFALARP